MDGFFDDNKNWEEDANQLAEAQLSWATFSRFADALGLSEEARQYYLERKWEGPLAYLNKIHQGGTGVSEADTPNNAKRRRVEEGHS